MQNNTEQVRVSVPKNEQAEYDLIGAILIDEGRLPEVVRLVEPEDFTNEMLGCIFRAMVGLQHDSKSPSPSLILGEMMRMGYQADTMQGVYGGPASYMTRCAEPFVFGIADERIADEYAQEIKRTSQMRRLIQVGGNIAAMGFEQGLSDVNEILAKSEAAIAGIRISEDKDVFTHIGVESEKELDRLEVGMLMPGAITGLATGITRLDASIGGLQKGALVVLASRPGMGKTSLAMNIAVTAARRGNNVCIFSMEMTSEELHRKMACMIARINTEAVKCSRLTDAEHTRYMGAIGEVHKLPIYVGDKSSVSIADMPAAVDEWIQRAGVDLLIVDYLQLVRGTKNKSWNREQEVAEVARGLKDIAMSRQIPVIACCQLNRQVEARADKTPELADLRESGEIEQAADIVAMLYRGEAYDKDCKEPNIATLFLKKNRSGEAGYVKMFCDMRYGLFGNLATTRAT